MIFIEVSQVETKIKDQSQEIEHLKTAAQIQSQEIEKLKQECQQIETRFKEIREQKEKWKVNLIFKSVNKPLYNKKYMQKKNDNWKADYYLLRMLWKGV